MTNTCASLWKILAAELGRVLFLAEWRRGPSHPDPEIRWGGGGPKKFFSALWASTWAKNKGEGPRPLPWIYHWIQWLLLGGGHLVWLNHRGFCRTKVWHIVLLEEDFLYTSSKIQSKQYHGVRYLVERGSEQWISWKPSAQKMVSDAYKRQSLKRVSKHRTFI